MALTAARDGNRHFEVMWSREPGKTSEWVRTGVSLSRTFERGHGILYAGMVKRHGWKIGPVGIYWLHFRSAGW